MARPDNTVTSADVRPRTNDAVACASTARVRRTDAGFIVTNRDDGTVAAGPFPEAPGAVIRSDAFDMKGSNLKVKWGTWPDWPAPVYLTRPGGLVRCVSSIAVEPCEGGAFVVLRNGGEEVARWKIQGSAVLELFNTINVAFTEEGNAAFLEE